MEGDHGVCMHELLQKKCRPMTALPCALRAAAVAFSHRFTTAHTVGSSKSHPSGVRRLSSRGSRSVGSSLSIEAV